MMDNEVKMVLMGEVCPCGALLNGEPTGFVRYCSVDCMPLHLKNAIEDIDIYRNYLVPGEVGTEQKGMTQEEYDELSAAMDLIH